MRLHGRMQRRYQFWGEVLLSVSLAVGSWFLALIPPFDHFGGISLALIVGMLVKALLWKQKSPAGGLAFTAKTLLRVGIVLLAGQSSVKPPAQRKRLLTWSEKS
jgi:uncharacterized membrane protein YadS